MKRLFILPLLLPLLAGCASLGFDDYGKYADTLASHSQAEARRISAQAGAIRDTVSQGGGTPTEKVLLAVIGTLEIERLQPVPLQIEKPFTGLQALNTLAGQATSIAGFGAMGWISTALASKIGNVNVSGENNSYAPFESHVTGSSGATVDIPYQSPTTTTTISNPGTMTGVAP